MNEAVEINDNPISQIIHEYAVEKKLRAEELRELFRF